MQHPGKESPDLVEHHRLDLNGEGRRSDGFALLDGPTRAMLHQLHWRRPPREPWRFALALTVVLLLHIAAVFVVRYEMRPGPATPVAVAPTRDNVIELRLIDAPRPPPAAPSIEPPPVLPAPAPRPLAPPARREPSANNAIQATVLPSAPPATAPATAPLRLFSPNGTLLPTAPVSAASVAPPSDYVQQHPRDDDRIMRHDHPVKYKATRFEKDWAPNMDVLDNAAKRVMDATMIKQDVPLPGGGHLHCTAAMMFMPVGCKTDDPPPPPKKDGDVRMNMAPANALVKDLPPSAESPSVPTEAECIAIYRKGDPLPQGCAPDTPIKAIDQEQAAKKRVP